jgi:hypothetical protein
MDQTPIWTPAPPVDPAELDRELETILAGGRATSEWTWRREGDDFTFWFPDKSRIRVHRVHERGDGVSAEIIDVEHTAYTMVCSITTGSTSVAAPNRAP